MGALVVGLVLFSRRSGPGVPPAADTRPHPTAGADPGVRQQESLSFGPAAHPLEIKEEEIRLASHMRDAFPRNASTWTLLGNVHYQHGDVPQAMDAWTRGLSLDPRPIDLYRKLGEAAAGMGDLDRALNYWQKGLKIDPNTPGLRWETAHALIEQGRHEEAPRLLLQEIQIIPDSTRSLFLLGQTYVQLKDYDKAIHYLEQALALDPNHANACYGLGTVYLRLKDRARAQVYLARFQKAKRIQADSRENQIPIDELPGARRRMARRYEEAYRIYEQAGHAAQGETLLARALQLDPENTRCLERLGMLQYSRHRLPEALQAFEQARHIDPGNPLFYLNCGKVCLALKRLPQAEQVLAQAVTRFPTNSHAHAELARFYLRTQPQNARALDLARTAVRYEASAPHYHLLAWASDVQGQPEAALQAINQALALAPNHQTYRILQRRLQQKVPSHAN